MAEYSVSNSNGRFTLKLTTSESNVSVENNTSVVNYTLQLIANTSYHFSDYGISYGVSINGSSVASGHASYSIDRYGTITFTSGSVTIPHNSDGSKTVAVSFYEEMSSVSYTAGNLYGSGNMTLTTIARKANISSAPNFNDEENPTITYSNPAGNSVSSLQACISLTGARDDIAYRNISKTGTSYTFNLTTEERNVLRNNCKDSTTRNVIFYVKTEIGSSTFYSTLTKTLTITNATPTISVTATPTDYSTLTGNPQTLIKGVSNVTVSVTATPLKEAYIKSIVSGGKTLLSGGTTAGVITKTGTIEGVTTNQISTVATDSRNIASAANVKSFTMVNYVPLTITTEVSRPNATSSTINAKVYGNYFNGTFGSQHNTLTLKWRYREKNAQWSSYSTLTTTLTNNTYLTQVALGTNFSYSKDYEFEFTATDKIGTKTYAIALARGVPIFDYGVDSNGNNYFNVNGDIYQNNKKILENNIITIGKNTDQNIPVNSNHVVVGMNVLTAQVGNKLSFSNNKVIIGFGIHHVVVSGLCWVEAHDGYKWGHIYKNNTVISSSITPKNTLENWDSIAFPPVLVEVQENDEICMAVAITGTANGKVAAGSYGKQSTYLTVEVID